MITRESPFIEWNVQFTSWLNMICIRMHFENKISILFALKKDLQIYATETWKEIVRIKQFTVISSILVIRLKLKLRFIWNFAYFFNNFTVGMEVSTVCKESVI